jgi:polo-like kinase 4
MVDRVRNEVHIHFQLKHPSILELFDYFEDESFVYLVMELCENGELYRYMQQRRSYNRPKSCDDKENISSKKDNALDTVQSGGDAKSLGTLTEPEARGLMQQIISGLIYLHTRGIIHRDLKLSNLLLTDRNDIVSV